MYIGIVKPICLLFDFDRYANNNCTTSNLTKVLLYMHLEISSKHSKHLDIASTMIENKMSLAIYMFFT